MNNNNELIKQLKAWGFILDEINNEYYKFYYTKLDNLSKIKVGTIIFRIDKDCSIIRIAFWEQAKGLRLTMTSLDTVYWEMKRYEEKLDEIYLHYVD